MDLARDMGMKVEQRPIKVEELATFEEAGACGTGAIITPIKKIVDKKANFVFFFLGDYVICFPASVYTSAKPA